MTDLTDGKPETPTETLTLEGWLRKTNELGYFITQRRIVETPMGWKAVVHFAVVILTIAFIVGGVLGGSVIAAKYYTCEERAS